MPLHKSMIFAVWFCLSVFGYIVDGILVYLFLRRNGIPISFLFSGTPGVVEYYYVKWCKSVGRSYRVFLTIRLLLVANLVLVTSYLFYYPT
jgi:hypothetical protein